ncbi:MAG: CIA30 family protein [Bacteroidota bacterium]
MSPANTPTGNSNASAPTTDQDQTTLCSFVKSGKGNWCVQDDVVMGGRSDSQLQMTEDNYAHFSGKVSLANNGGFCSIHQVVEQNPYRISVNASAFTLRVKGDGKTYNFRVRTPNGRHSYALNFPTQASGEWEEITLPFKDMAATFRGRSINVPNYAGEEVLEM